MGAFETAHKWANYKSNSYPALGTSGPEWAKSLELQRQAITNLEDLQLSDGFLNYLHYLACFEATGTHLHVFDRTLILSSDFLEVRVPSASGFIVRVTDVIPEKGSFVTHITSLGHSFTP